MNAEVHPILALDLLPDRREAALEAGATYTAEPRKQEEFEALLDQLGGGTSTAIDLSASPTGLDTAIKATAPLGTIVMSSGVEGRYLTFDYLTAMLNGHVLKGGFVGLYFDRAPAVIDEWLRLVAAGIVKPPVRKDEAFPPGAAVDVYRRVIEGDRSARSPRRRSSGTRGSDRLSEHPPCRPAPDIGTGNLRAELAAARSADGCSVHALSIAAKIDVSLRISQRWNQVALQAAHGTARVGVTRKWPSTRAVMRCGPRRAGVRPVAPPNAVEPMSNQYKCYTEDLHRRIVTHTHTVTLMRSRSHKQAWRLNFANLAEIPGQLRPLTS